MSTSHEDISSFASENYGAYKDAYAEYAFLLMSAVVQMDTSAQKSRARTQDISVGRSGDQITLPLEDMKYHDAEAERLEAAANKSYEKAGEYAVAGAAHYHANTDAYHELAATEDRERSSRIDARHTQTK